jgi:hypothetical protein
VPHIWPGFGQMWEETNARATVQIVPEDVQGEIREFPHLAKRMRDMGLQQICRLDRSEAKWRNLRFSDA